MIKKILKFKWLYIAWFFSVLAICLNIVISNYLSLVAFSIFLVVAVFLKPNELICFMFGIMPFANIFKLGPGSTSLFTVCELIAVIILLIKNKKIKSSVLVGMIVLTAYFVVFSVNNLDFLLIAKIIIGFLFIGFYVSFFKQSDIIHIAYLLSFGIIIMLVLTSNNGYFKYVIPYFDDLNYYLDNTGNYSEIIRNSGFLGDPNYCSVMLIVILSLLCVLYFYKKIGIEFWILFAIIIPFGFLTYSKSYLISLLLLLIWLIVFVLFPKNKFLSIISLIGLIILMSILFSGNIEIIEMIIKRFDMNDLTTGRHRLNIIYLDYIFNDVKVFLFGSGINMEKIAGVDNNVHNIFIELLFKIGVLGSIIYISVLFLCLKTSNKMKSEKIRLVNLTPTLFVLLMFFFLAGISTYELPFYIIICYLGVKCK